MALNEGECKQCQVELDKMKALPGELARMPEAQDRVAKLETVLGGECNSSSGSSDFGKAIVLGGVALGVVALAALFGGKQ